MKEEVNNLLYFQSNEKVCYIKEFNKTLYCTLQGSFEVWENGVLVLETLQAVTALEKYNSIS